MTLFSQSGRWILLPGLLTIVLAITGCKEKEKVAARFPDPAVMEAVAQLRQVSELTEQDPDLAEYGARVEAVTANLDTILADSRDESAKAKVQQALALHIATHQQWNQANNNGGSLSDLKSRWRQARLAADFAANFATTSPALIFNETSCTISCPSRSRLTRSNSISPRTCALRRR